jgi:hypothetical protein
VEDSDVVYLATQPEIAIHLSVSENLSIASANLRNTPTFVAFSCMHIVARANVPENGYEGAN